MTKLNVSDEFLELMEALEVLVEKTTEAIDNAQIEHYIPYHYNTLEVVVPSFQVQKFMPGLDVDITVLYSKTKFSESYGLEYNYENILEYYKTVGITIGKLGTLKNYHVNAKHRSSNESAYKIIQDNIERLYNLDKNYDYFPQLTAEGIYNLIDNLVTIVEPSSSRFPRSFQM